MTSKKQSSAIHKQKKSMPSKSKIHRFLRIIPRHGRFIIPKSFTRKYGDVIPNPLHLKTPDGREWNVSWRKNHGNFLFQKGWRDFKTHYSLAFGHLLLFEYDKETTSFMVFIFDKRTLDLQQTNSNREPSPLSSPQVSKKSKTEDDMRGRNESQKEELQKNKNPSFKAFMTTTDLKQYFRVLKQFASEYLKEEENNVILEALDGRTWPCKYSHGRLNQGWKFFVLDNHLKLGDALVFELIDDSQNYTFKVEIHPVGNDETHPPPPQVYDKPHVLPPYGQATCSNSNLGRINKHLEELYFKCTRKNKNGAERDELVANIGSHFLTRRNLECMRERHWLDDAVFSVMADVMMGDESIINPDGVFTRFILSPLFSAQASFDFEEFKLGHQQRWGPSKIMNLIHHPLEKLSRCKMVFAPTCFDHHWMCYALDIERMELCVLDSLYDHTKVLKLQLFDNLMRYRFEELVGVVYPNLDSQNLIVQYVKGLPKQQNNYDCGVYVLMFLEMWNGLSNWTDNPSMPTWSNEDISRFRKEIVWRFVLHHRNTNKENLLKRFHLPLELDF